MTLFSPDLKSHRLVSPIRLSVLGRADGTYLHYDRSYSINVFLFGGSGSRGSGLTCGQKLQIPGKFPAISRKISRTFPGNFHGISLKMSPDFPGKFPRTFPGNFPGFFGGEMIKCAYRFYAPDAMMMVRTATPVLHDARTRCLAPCLGRQPAITGGHFPAGERERETQRDSEERERGRERVRGDADLQLLHMGGRSSTMPG